MPSLPGVLAGLRALLRRDRARRELDAELDAYVAEASAARVAAGVEPAEAERQARRALGNQLSLREDVHAAGWEHHVETLVRDLRLGGRLIRRTPALSATVIATLALGIGGNTAILMLVNTVYFAPLPIPEPDRVVRLLDSAMTDGATRRTFTMSPDNAATILRESSLFTSVVATAGRSLTITGGDSPERVSVVSRTSGWGTTLGVRPALGRDFTMEEERRGGASGVVLVSDGLWRRRYPGATPGAAGLELDGRPFTIVGVMPPGFRFPYDADVWMPLVLGEPAAPRGFAVFGRLRAGVTEAQLTPALDVVSRRLRTQYPDQPPNYATVAWPLRRNLVENQTGTLMALLSVVGFLLLLACINVATLLLARGIARRREFVIRSMLGATRVRQLSQVLAESLVLAGAGGAVGLLLARWLSAFTAVLIPSNISTQLGMADPVLDWRVLAATATLTAGVGVGAGLLPAINRLRSAEPLVMKDEGRAPSGRGAAAARLLAALVVGETAIALVLLVATGVMAQHLRFLQDRDLGLQPSGLLTLSLSPSRATYGTPADRARLVQAIDQEIARLPGVRAAGITTVNPLGGATWTVPVSADDGGGPRGQAPVVQVHHRLVTPALFTTMGIPLLAGRAFTDDDDARRPPVVIVSAAMARRLWGEADPLGRRVRVAAPEAPWFTVVGVVGNVQDSREPDAPAETWYLPIAQRAGSPAADTLHLMVRTDTAIETMADSVRAALRRVDRTLAAHDVAAMDEYYAETIERERFGTQMMTTFGLFGLVLAALGVYGVTSFAVAQRGPEIGVRIALGAAPGRILRQVLGRGLRLGLAGILIGAFGSHLVVDLIRAGMPGMRASETAALAGAALALIAVSIVACYVPARRAARIDPLQALRQE